MNKVKLNVLTSTLMSKIQADIEDAITAINLDYKPSTTDNEYTDKEANMYVFMAGYAIYSIMHSIYGKKYENIKKALDSGAIKLDKSPEGVAGTTVDIISIGDLTFQKRQNKDGTGISTTDLVTALARLGVDKAIVDKAVSAATKDKRGNTYYIVETKD